MAPNTDPRGAAAGPLATVRAVYDAFARRDVAALGALLHPDVEVAQSDALPWGGVYRGRDEALRFLGRLGEHIDTGIEVERLIVAGDDVVEVGRTRGRALSSGREFAIDEVHVWTVRDGAVVRMRAYVDDEAMLAALAP